MNQMLDKNHLCLVTCLLLEQKKFVLLFFIVDMTSSTYEKTWLLISVLLTFFSACM